MFPQYLLAASGVIYAAGFLVVILFFDRFGISEAGAEIWRAKFIHVGILCVFFPVILSSTIFPLVYLIKHSKYPPAERWLRGGPILGLLVNLELVCYLFILLTRRNSAGSLAGFGSTLFVFWATLVGLFLTLGVDCFLKNRGCAQTRCRIIVALRLLLMLAMMLADYLFVEDLRGVFLTMSIGLCLTYVVSCGVLVAMAFLSNHYIKRQRTAVGKKALGTLALSLIAACFYVVVLTFSYGIYQHIPATRGGGDFSSASLDTFEFGGAQSPSPEGCRFFGRSMRKTRELIVIEETSWGFFVADPHDAGGPKEWKSINGRKPVIYLIKKDIVKRAVIRQEG